MPLQATSGAASYDGFGGGVPFEPTYIEQVFATHLYTGTGSDLTINNGIDLSTKGGLVWMKSRNDTQDHYLYDTNRGNNKYLASNLTAAQGTFTGIAFNTNGYTDKLSWSSSTTVASWTFRKQPKFFDVVTWTGDGTSNRAISHSLGSAPGCIIAKRTDAVGNWNVYHRGVSPANDNTLTLNTTSSASGGGQDIWGNGVNVTTPTTTLFYVAGQNNNNGVNYVAYLFAHNAGGFGLTGTDNVISCGSYTGNGSATGPSISLGYEPQWLMIKRAVGGTSNWNMYDTMRGMPVPTAPTFVLQANLAGVEYTGPNYFVAPNATGFDITSASSDVNTNGSTYIYIAIRRGPMKTPTSGTSVFYSQAIAQANTIDSTGVPFPPDLVNTFSRNGTNRTNNYQQFMVVDRLRGLGTPNDTFTASGPGLITSSTAAELPAGAGGSYVQVKADGQNITRGGGWNDPQYGSWIYYFMRRAPGFFDVVCYTGTGAGQTVNHNLGVVPELIILKNRSSGSTDWPVKCPVGLTDTGVVYLNLDLSNATGVWQTGDTSTTFKTRASSNLFYNQSGQTYVAYLFASCPGVSKVGSYTGTGTTLQVNCGFTGGSRFVLIKRTDSTGDWYVWDSARGIVAGNDPYLLLNSTAAEVTSTDYVDTYSAGFEISSTAPAAINANGGTFIFLAIA